MAKRKYNNEVVGYDRSKGGLTAAARYYKKKKPIPATVKRAVKAAIKKELELKCLDATVVVPAISDDTSDNSSMGLINTIGQGAAVQNRVGNTVTLESLRVRGEIRHVTNMTGQSVPDIFANACRMVVVYDKYPGTQLSAIPSWAEIFGGVDATGADFHGIWCNAEMEAGGRFELLCDRTITFTPSTMPMLSQAAPVAPIGAITTQIVYVDEFIKLKDRKTEYATNSGTITVADISKGALYIGFKAIFDSSANFIIVGSATLSRFNTRLRFRDG